MGRRGLHDEGSTLLQERLKGKIDVDFDTARRLFTLHLRAASEGLTGCGDQMARSCRAPLCSPAPSIPCAAPMAAAMMRHLYGRFVYVDSAGARAGELDPMAVEVMDEIGIEIGKPQAQALRGSGRRLLRPDRHAVAGGPSQGDGADPHAGRRRGILADAWTPPPSKAPASSGSTPIAPCATNCKPA